jgi:predicted Zn-dependent protease
VFLRYLVIGQVHVLQSRTEEAIVWLERARNANPAHPEPYAWLASANALKGDLYRAIDELAEAGRLVSGMGASGMRASTIVRLREGYWGIPAIRTLYETTYFAGLRKAGMPEG